MSLSNRIANLIAGILDPKVRMDVAATVNYLFTVYSSGGADENAIRGAIREICVDVLSATYPDLTRDEVLIRVENVVDEFMHAFRVESAMKRTLSRFRYKALTLP